MNVAGLPTDNLYKFMAISGLLVIGFSIYFPTTETRTLENQIESIEAEAALLEVDLHYLEGDFNRIDTTAANQGSKEMSKLREKAKELRGHNEVLKVKTKALTRLTGDARRTAIAGVVGTLLGAILAIAGFKLWYDRLQRFQDAAARGGKPS